MILSCLLSFYARNSQNTFQVTTPLLFKLIPAVVHLGVLMRWFPPDASIEVTHFILSFGPFCCFIYNYLDFLPMSLVKQWWYTCILFSLSWTMLYLCWLQIGFKGDNLRVDSGKQRVILMVQGAHNSWTLAVSSNLLNVVIYRKLIRILFSHLKLLNSHTHCVITIVDIGETR